MSIAKDARIAMPGAADYGRAAASDGIARLGARTRRVVRMARVAIVRGIVGDCRERSGRMENGK